MNKARSQILGMVLYCVYKNNTYIFTDACIFLLMHRNVFGRIHWLPLKIKLKDLGEKKAYFALNILFTLLW